MAASDGKFEIGIELRPCIVHVPSKFTQDKEEDSE